MQRRIAALLMLVLAGCASAGGTENTSRTGNKNRNLITAEEVRNSNATNAYLLVQSLRPNMLTARGATSITLGDPGVIVFLDDQRFGNVEALKTIHPNQIEQIRYLSASEAQNRWGTGFPQGVIQVMSRRGK
jgi:hypothetical protein